MNGGPAPSRPHHIRGGLGVAVIGCGTIGTLRAQILHRHPAVSYLAVCDTIKERAETLARACEADRWASDATELVNDPAVQAVIVATTEDAHYGPALAALSADKHVLVEKPFTIDSVEGECLCQDARDRGLQLYTGFTQRFRRRYLSVKQHVEDGYLGQLTSAHLSIYLTRAVAQAVMSRAGSTTPAINTLTYCIDLLRWFFPDDPPARVYAQAGQGRIRDSFGAPDSTWCILTLRGGAVVNLGVSWELPEFWPAYVASMQVELFGRDGSLSVHDDHRDVLLASTHAVPSPYTPDVTMPVAMLGSAMPGDWAGGDFFGAMRDETYAFVRSVGTGLPDPALPDGRQGLDVLTVSRAIDESAASGQVVPVALMEGVAGA